MLKEYRAESLGHGLRGKLQDYMLDILALEVDEGEPKASHWTFGIEPHGVVIWTSPHYPALSIYATPFYDGQEGLAIQILDNEGEDLYNRTIPFVLSGEINSDIDGYKHSVGNTALMFVRSNLQKYRETKEDRIKKNADKMYSFIESVTEIGCICDNKKCVKCDAEKIVNEIEGK